jgi:monovalent cation:H+ antiporter-2, CPA2 family
MATERHAAVQRLVVAGKIVSVALASTLVGERPNTAVKSGFAMAQIAVFAILICEVGTGGAATHNFRNALAVGVCAVTAFLCPLLVRASNPVADWIDRRLPLPVQSALSRYGGVHRMRKSSKPAMTERGDAGENEIDDP